MKVEIKSYTYFFRGERCDVTINKYKKDAISNKQGIMKFHFGIHVVTVVVVFLFFLEGLRF